MTKRILVDMSATLIHHGHIRLLQKAAKLGDVIVALTIDEEIETKKGYMPELTYESREEILRAIKYVKDVIPSPWEITMEYINQNNIDLLVHGSDNSNKVDREKLIIFERTSGVSSSELRARAAKIVDIQNA